MRGLLNKGALIILCAVLQFGHGVGPYAVVPVIIAVTGAALGEYLEGGYRRAAVLCALAAAAVWYAPLVYYVPVLAYDGFSARPRWVAAAAGLPLIAHFARPDPLGFVLIVACAVLAALLKQQAAALERQRRDNLALRDGAAELSSSLMRRNKALIESQDSQLKLATLSERNRIAREMHDTVGHLLASAILQTGALLTTSQDEGQSLRLRELHKTLTSGMAEVRGAIHGLYDESIDLKSELQALTRGFEGAQVSIDYDLSEDMDKRVQYAFIAVVKEALSNVARHSNATKVDIALHEHPALYQLIIRDNGTRIDPALREGMGLSNIRTRIEQLGGIMTIRKDRGFELFLSVRKEENAS